ncbi:OmpA family protein [Motilimonas pumila]|uniref:DUF4892 domain-containing protein n=1 Tax=Motilimonas pumila TaxID=2303987 RepID=A0A418YAF0_9GAMM|nr:OmpA family protein [Motilimonas pumila]RJG39522.1 DUF4892 domain-containing protein [Motilimonas pumila]
MKIKMLRVLLLTSLLFGQAYAEEVPILLPNNSSLQFSSYHKNFDIVEIVAGAVEDVTSDDSKDLVFKAQKTIQVEGKVDAYTYDFSSEYTSVELVFKQKEYIASMGYEIVYECERVSCGSPMGWKLYLSEHIFGNQNEQYYFLARKNNKEGEVGTYLSFYINTISGSPRVDIMKVDGRFANLFKDRNEKISTEILNTGTYVIPNVFFSSSSAELNTDSKKVLKEVADFLIENKSQNFYIVGHSDSDGDQQDNLKLSQKRAKAVYAELVKVYNVQKSQLQFYGVGELQPYSENRTEVGKSRNRRVELVAN